jgi:hypothetical protein
MGIYMLKHLRGAEVWAGFENPISERFPESTNLEVQNRQEPEKETGSMPQCIRNPSHGPTPNTNIFSAHLTQLRSWKVSFCAVSMSTRCAAKQTQTKPPEHFCVTQALQTPTAPNIFGDNEPFGSNADVLYYHCGTNSAASCMRFSGHVDSPQMGAGKSKASNSEASLKTNVLLCVP